MPCRKQALLPVLLLLPALAGFAQQDAGAPMQLAPGDYHWIPVQISETPAVVDATFREITGQPTVHLELMSMTDFRLYYSHREHESLASTTPGISGAFRRMIESRGRYALVVSNDRNAPPATVSLEVRTDVDPAPLTVATPLSPSRRLTVILISFAVFFGTVCWSGWKISGKIR